MSTIVDVAFPATGPGPIPADHGFALFAALTRQCPELREEGVGIHPISGRPSGPRHMQLGPSSRVTIRLPDDRVPLILHLAGRSIQLHQRPIELGLPVLSPLSPAPVVRSRLVTVKNRLDPEPFRLEIRRQLSRLGVSDAVQIRLPHNDGPTSPRRRTLRIRGLEIVGHEVLLENLSVRESLDVQAHGLGGRRHMGCGVFVPLISSGWSRGPTD